MLSISTFLQLLKESFRDLLPIILVIMFFQLAIIQSVPPNWLSTAIGLAIVLGVWRIIKGRNPILDGFGLIAFASLFPMITVMLYGIITEKMEKSKQ